MEVYSQKEKKKITIIQPAIVKCYNKGMGGGGVDVFDGHIASYRINIRGKKWWWPHLINTIDCLKAASYSVYTIAVPDRKQRLSYLEFIRRIVISCMPRREGLGPIVSQKVSVWKGDQRVIPEVRLDGKDHWPTKGVQRRCALKACLKKSHYGCEKCGVGLCVVCFKGCHTSP